jgi:glucose/arabinose dehydrogenase
MAKILLIVLGVIVLLVGALFIFGEDLIKSALAPQDLNEVTLSGLQLSEIGESSIEIIARDLVIPWGVDFLPDGDILVTERPGTLKRIGSNGASFEIQGVEHIGEGGLMGLAVHPNFAQNSWIYLYFTSRAEEGLINRVERYSLIDNNLNEKVTLLEDIPGAFVHDGGRMAFGPDGYLYITTGESGDPTSAQSLDNLGGKILRMTDEGEIPADNPFGTLVYSYGHRNPQGISWDENGNLWSSEHGPSGVASGQDEINLILPGNNYGWPASKGDVVEPGTVGPVLQSGEEFTWAPASAAYLNGSLFFGGLRGASLYEAKIRDGKIDQLFAHFYTDYGRIRTVLVGPDGWLYITTSNTDGRGYPNDGDDLLLRIDPAIFQNTN